MCLYITYIFDSVQHLNVLINVYNLIVTFANVINYEKITLSTDVMWLG